MFLQAANINSIIFIKSSMAIDTFLCQAKKRLINFEFVIVIKKFIHSVWRYFSSYVPEKIV